MKTTLNDLLFPVRMEKNTEWTNSYNSRKVVAEIDGKDKVLNYCSSRFNLLKNIDVYPLLEQMLIDAECEFEKYYTIDSDHAIFGARYVIKKVKGVDVGIRIGNTDDVIYAEIRMYNSYNGKKQGMMSLGYYRLICENGLTIPLEGHEEKNLKLSGKHTQKLNLTFNTLVQKLEGFLGMQDVLKKRFEVLTDRKVEKYADRVEEVMKATKVSASEAQFGEILATISREASDLYGGVVNDFLVYNGINAHIYKSKTAKGKTKKSTPDAMEAKDKAVLNYIMKTDLVTA